MNHFDTSDFTYRICGYLYGPVDSLQSYGPVDSTHCSVWLYVLSPVTDAPQHQCMPIDIKSLAVNNVCGFTLSTD